MFEKWIRVSVAEREWSCVDFNDYYKEKSRGVLA